MSGVAVTACILVAMLDVRGNARQAGLEVGDLVALRLVSGGMMSSTPPGTASLEPGASAMLATKYHAPHSRRRLVARGRLVAHLSAGLATKLTVVCGPAGSGKTTIVLEWCRRDPASHRFAWVALDPDDADPSRFWAYAVHALAEVVEPGLAEPLRLVDNRLVDVRRVLIPSLVNSLEETLTESVVLVLDDYHLVHSGLVDAQLAFLIEHAPGLLHIVVSRERPALYLARLRAQGELAEVGAADLRFSRAETAELLTDVLNLRLTAREVLELQRRTEGWAVALHLTALSLRLRGDAAATIADFTGEHEHLVEYLGAEILSCLEPGLRTFLRETSILDRICAPLREAVTQRTDSEQQLMEAERLNLLIVPLDERRVWFRYHHLFTEMLRRELSITEPDQVRGLHQRASAWHAEEGDAQEAIRHALAAAEEDTAHRLVGEHWNRYYNFGRLATVSGWLDALGDQRVRGDAWLSAARVLIWADEGRLERLDAWLDADQHPPVDGYPYAILRALHRFKSGDLAWATVELERAAAARTETEPFWSTVEQCVRGAVGYWSGDVQIARSALATAAELARTHGNAAGRTYSLSYLCLIAVDERDFTTADRILAELSTSSGPGSEVAPQFSQALPLIAPGRLHAERGHADQARTHLERALSVARLGAGRLEHIAALSALARLIERSDDRPRASMLLTEATATLSLCPDPRRGAALLADQPESRGRTRQPAESPSPRAKPLSCDCSRHPCHYAKSARHSSFPTTPSRPIPAPCTANCRRPPARRPCRSPAKLACSRPGSPPRNATASRRTMH